MNLKGFQTQRLLAMFGAFFGAMILAGPAAAQPDEDGGMSSRTSIEGGSVSWYLTDEYRPFVLPESEANAVVNQRQLELAADKQFQVQSEQTWEVIPYLSQGILTEADAAAVAVQRTTPDGYQPQLGANPYDLGSRADRPDGYQPQLGASDLASTSAVSFRESPDGHQPQLAGSESGTVADDGFDLTTTGVGTAIFAALLVAVAITFIRGNRHGYRSA